VDPKFKYEIELSRNWHWVWSKFYFNKKHYGTLKAIRELGFGYISSILKYLFYSILKNNLKKKKIFAELLDFIMRY